MLRNKIIEKIFMTIIRVLQSENTANSRKIACQETTIYMKKGFALMRKIKI